MTACRSALAPDQFDFDRFEEGGLNRTHANIEALIDVLGQLEDILLEHEDEFQVRFNTEYSYSIELNNEDFGLSIFCYPHIIKVIKLIAQSNPRVPK